MASYNVSPDPTTAQYPPVDVSTYTLKRLALGAQLMESALDAAGGTTGRMWYFNGSVWALALS